MLPPFAAVRPTRLVGAGVLLALVVSLVSPTTATTLSAAGAAPSWLWPVDAPRQVLRPFIAPATPYAAGHRGIDIAAPPDAAVRAPADGTVSFSGIVVDRPVLSLRHTDGLISSFEPVSSPLAAGAVVHRGDIVGTLVAGHCAAWCLHFGVRRYGEYVSPLNYLGGIPHSVLLPTRVAR